MALAHVTDQGANGVDDWSRDIPEGVYARACAMAEYHMQVALVSRPPSSARTADFRLKLDDTVEIVKLRRQILKMRGVLMSGTDLKKAGVFEGSTPDAWKRSCGYQLPAGRDGAD